MDIYMVYIFGYEQEKHHRPTIDNFYFSYE